jgi:hypothetical protein
MRASISPNTYLAIYDKIIVQGLTPSCPINLGDILKSCVAGWKRDNEWPPKSTVAGIQNASATRSQASQNPAPTRQRRRSFMQMVMAGKGSQEQTGPKTGGWARIMMNAATARGKDDVPPTGGNIGTR